MSFDREEQVLVIPTEVFHDRGLFQGLCRETERYLPHLLEPQVLRFMPRSLAEMDPNFKQIIPYIVLRCGDRIFHYQRGRQSTEKRLHSLRSLGLGGHISQEDAEGSADLYRTGMLREILEEVDLKSEYTERCVGLINDDATPVGQVHLGVVHLFDLEHPLVLVKENGLLESGFASLKELRSSKEQFESWSQFLLAADVL